MGRFLGRYIFTDEDGKPENVSAVCEATDKYAARAAFMEYGACQSIEIVAADTPLSGPFAAETESEFDDSELDDDGNVVQGSGGDVNDDSQTGTAGSQQASADGPDDSGVGAEKGQSGEPGELGGQDAGGEVGAVENAGAEGSVPASEQQGGSPVAGGAQEPAA